MLIIIFTAFPFPTENVWFVLTPKSSTLSVTQVRRLSLKLRAIIVFIYEISF
ncbi:uncharacterized protein DS421_17g589510 [Arachis hypogaea]|nr:uncharacterized protein DS421_17g589510 [Arachis hypogaea]